MNRARRALTTLAVWAVAAVGLGCLAAAALGARAVTVLTGSMEPAYATGSLVLTTRLEPGAVRVGQVVAFRPPAPYSQRQGRPVLHRVIALQEVDGIPVMRTRGDANQQPDPWQIALPGADLALARGHVPVLGRVTAAGRGAVGLVALGTACLLAARPRRREARLAQCDCVPGAPAPSQLQSTHAE